MSMTFTVEIFFATFIFFLKESYKAILNFVYDILRNKIYYKFFPLNVSCASEETTASEETCRTDDGSHVYGYGDDVAAADRCQSKDYYIYTYIFS